MRLQSHWLRLSLRTLLILIALVAVWLGVQVKWIQDRHAALRWLDKRGSYSIAVTGEGGGPYPAPWQIRMLGEQGTMLIWLEPIENETPLYSLADLSRLFPEAEVDRYVMGGEAERD